MSIKDELRVNAKAINKQLKKLTQQEKVLLQDVKHVTQYVQFEKNLKRVHVTKAGNIGIDVRGMTDKQIAHYNEVLKQLRAEIGTVKSRKLQIEEIKKTIGDDAVKKKLEDAEKVSKAWSLFHYIKENFPRFWETVGGSDAPIEKWVEWIDKNGGDIEKLIDTVAWLEENGTPEEIHDFFYGDES